MTNKFAFAGVLAGFGYFAYSMIYGDTPKETETNNELKLKNTKSVDEKSNEPVKEKKQDTKEEPVSEEQVTEKQVTEEKVKEEPVSEEPILEELQMNELNVEELSDVKKETIYNLEKNTPNNEHIEEQIKKIESEKLNKETHIEKTIVL